MAQTSNGSLEAETRQNVRHLPAAVGSSVIPAGTLPDGIVAASEEMRELVNVIRAIAPTEITVLLLGESGTGKEVLARLIHDLSHRKRGPFVTVNCGAIPEGLIESELFGHEKGSFTGAHAQRKGFFESAHGGTIFLDEIGELPINLQPKLLRVLETGTFSRVGSALEIKTDARAIAATNRDLELEVRAGRFRADLYYRLRAVMLKIPPLRNRREDIPFLIEEMLKEFVARHKLPSMPRIATDAIHMLIDHEWRGNVRELRNTIEQLVVLSGVGHSDRESVQITAQDVDRLLDGADEYWQEPQRNLPVATLPKAQDQSERELIYRALIELRGDLAELKQMLRHGNSDNQEGSVVPTRALPPRTNGSAGGNHDEILTLEELERTQLRKALVRFNGNRREAAHALGISERTLYRKLKEQGLDGN